MKMSKEFEITYAQLQTLYKVSQIINSQLDLKSLLEDIMDMTVELLSAGKGLICLFDKSGTLSVEVARDMDAHAIKEVVAMSHSIISEVTRDDKPIFIEDVPSAPTKKKSTSLVLHKIKSVLCVPLRSKDQLIGVIYMDTSGQKQFFRKEHFLFIQAFSNLAGLAIENARNYQEIENLNLNLEKKVKKRTKDLRKRNNELAKAYRELRDTQLQLIRSEKIASLGKLVAGVAHEINTPLGAINSNTDIFLRSIEKLEKEFSELNSDSLKASSLKIHNLIDTVCNLSKDNKTACGRVSKIIKNLKTFSRLDEEEFKKVNIHEGINSSLELIGHSYKGRVKIQKEYGDIPLLSCQVAQINQVFSNILMNAFEAIEGKGVILIKTYHKDDEVCVRISDTGSGIPQANIKKIYDPGFTTKGAGVGTGLGLSIVYKIIEDHNGKIEVESKQGKGTTYIVKFPLNN